MVNHAGSRPIRILLPSTSASQSDNCMLIADGKTEATVHAEIATLEFRLIIVEIARGVAEPDVHPMVLAGVQAGTPLFVHGARTQVEAYITEVKKDEESEAATVHYLTVYNKALQTTKYNMHESRLGVVSLRQAAEVYYNICT